MKYVLDELIFRIIDFMIGTVDVQDTELDDFVIYDVTIFKNGKVSYKNGRCFKATL